MSGRFVFYLFDQSFLTRVYHTISQSTSPTSLIIIRTITSLHTTTVYFFTEGLKRFTRKDGLDGQTEVFADAECEVQAGIEVTAFEVAKGLVVDTQGTRKIQAGEITLSA